MTTVGCLIGNGFSIAYNPELSMPQLSQDLVAAFSALSGSAAEKTLASFASKFGGDKAKDFEGLLGPMDDVATSLLELQNLLPLTSEAQGEVFDALEKSGKFVRMLHRVGFGITLDMIADRARAKLDSPVFNDVILETCSALLDLVPDDFLDWVTIGTLNYDGLLHAGFLHLGSPGGLADLGNGKYKDWRSPTEDASLLLAHPLRRASDIPADRKVEILNLHGSLSWLQSIDFEGAWKFDLGTLRDMGYWWSLRQGHALLYPLVVLTNRKPEAVSRWPFNLAYEIFETRLNACDHWLILGYGFGDKPVNQLLRSTWQRRVEREKVPSLLVITRSNRPKTRRKQIAKILGADVEHLLIDGSGIPDAVGGSMWQTWASGS